MGSAASTSQSMYALPEEIDKATAKSVLGDSWSEEVEAMFDDIAASTGDGCISKETFLVELQKAGVPVGEGDVADHSAESAEVAIKPRSVTYLRHLLVAVDGTELAHNAFLTALYSYNDGDKITVVHYYNSQKEGLPADMMPAVIKKKYEDLLAADSNKVGNARWTVDSQDIVQTNFSTTKEAISAYANRLCDDLYCNELAAVVMFSGYSGRKGLYSKNGGTSKPTIMGSTTDFSMREAKCTNVITKPGSAVPVTDTPDTYVVYIDGNDSATQVATDVLTMMRPEDKVVFMHMVQRGQDEKSKPEGLLDSWWPGTIKEKFTKMLQQAGRQGEVKLVELENKHVYTLAIPNELNKMAEAVGASFIAIAADLVGAFHFDEGMQLIPQTDTKKSVSDRVVRTAKSTVIVSYSSQTAAQQIEEKAQGVASQILNLQQAELEHGNIDKQTASELKRKSMSVKTGELPAGK